MFQIQKPFNLIDRIGEENDEWDFRDDPSISVFTYLSCLGSGYLTVLFILLLQIIIPLLLVFSAFSREALSCNGVKLDEETFLAKAMAVVVFAYYLVSGMCHNILFKYMCMCVSLSLLGLTLI